MAECLPSLTALDVILGIIDGRALNSTDTGEPVLSGSILSNHSVLSGRFSKFRHFYPVITVISSPLNGHPNDAVVVTFSLQRPIVIALHICRTFT